MTWQPIETAPKMKSDIRESEAWVIRQAERLSAEMQRDPRNATMPAYMTTVDALAVLLANTYQLPCYRELSERVQREHRARAHGGGRTDQCEACGWYDGAAYKAATGREYGKDFPELFPSLKSNRGER